MQVLITLHTTDNQYKTFAQNDATAFADIGNSLMRYQQLFSKKSLLIVAHGSTTVFNPALIARIEMVGSDDIKQYLTSQIETVITALSPEQTLPREILERDYFSGQVDFFFIGGKQLCTWIEEPRTGHQIDRIASFNHIFDHGAIPYATSSGGIGFMNPAVITRVQIHASTKHRPTDSWMAEPLA